MPLCGQFNQHTKSKVAHCQGDSQHHTPKERCDPFLALVPMVVALVTILLNNSGDGPEGIEGVEAGREHRKRSKSAE